MHEYVPSFKTDGLTETPDDGFESLTLFQRLFDLADEAASNARGESIRTDSVPADSEAARRAVAAKACLPQPTFVQHGDWICSVAVLREGVTEE